MTVNMPELKKISSDFLLSEEGVIVKVELNADQVFHGALFYDGRNQAILGRNNKDFYLLQSIPPLIRHGIFKSARVMVAECTGEEVHQAYWVEVVQLDEILGEDTFIEDYEKHFAKLEEMYGRERVNKFKEAALAAWRKIVS